MEYSFYPCTQRVRQIRQAPSAFISVESHKNKQLAKRIIRIATNHQPTLNPFQRLSQIYQYQKKQNSNKDYFDLDANDLQFMVNQLNVQCTLSKKQLDQREVNGYMKSKVCDHQRPQKYILFSLEH